MLAVKKWLWRHADIIRRVCLDNCIISGASNLKNVSVRRCHKASHRGICTSQQNMQVFRFDVFIGYSLSRYLLKSKLHGTHRYIIDRDKAAIQKYYWCVKRITLSNCSTTSISYIIEVKMSVRIFQIPTGDDPRGSLGMRYVGFVIT